jgi:hypothetical protein
VTDRGRKIGKSVDVVYGQSLSYKIPNIKNSVFNISCLNSPIRNKKIRQNQSLIIDKTEIIFLLFPTNELLCFNS